MPCHALAVHVNIELCGVKIDDWGIFFCHEPVEDGWYMLSAGESQSKYDGDYDVTELTLLLGKHPSTAQRVGKASRVRNVCPFYRSLRNRQRKEQNERDNTTATRESTCQILSANI